MQTQVPPRVRPEDKSAKEAEGEAAQRLGAEKMACHAVATHRALMQVRLELSQRFIPCTRCEEFNAKGDIFSSGYPQHAWVFRVLFVMDDLASCLHQAHTTSMDSLVRHGVCEFHVLPDFHNRPWWL